jgi:hypothetical protein
MQASIGLVKVLDSILTFEPMRVLGCYELKQPKPWFDDERQKLLDERNNDKFQCLRTRSQMNGNNLNSVKHVKSKHFEKHKL